MVKQHSRRSSRGGMNLLASAAFGTQFFTPLSAAAAPETYDDVIAAVLKGLRTEDAGQPQLASAAERFDIVPGPLGDAISAFQAQTGIVVSVSVPEINDIHTAGVTGTFSPEQALERLLVGTGLTHRFTAPKAATIEIIGQSEFVRVSGSPAPALSSPKLTAPLREIPQTITIISSDVMQAQGATTLRDVLRNVPGVTFQAGEGGGGLPGDSFTMRGFSAGNDMFIDGVRDAGGYSRDAFNIEQVEVIKGPASSIAGRGSTGGAINQVSKSPNLTETRRATVGAGTAAYRRGTLDLNQPLTALGDGVAFRLNAMWTESGVPGRDVVENGSWGAAPAFAVGLGSPTTISVKSQHLRQDNVPDYGLPWGSYPGYPAGAFDADPPVDQTNFYGLRDYDFEAIESDIATVDASHRAAGGFALRSLTRYSSTSRDSAITSPRPPNRQLQRRTMTNEVLANQTNVSAIVDTGRFRHEMATGLDFSRELTGNRNSAQTTNQPPTSLTDPDPNERPFGEMPPNTGNPSATTLRQIGVYAFDTVHVSDRWEFTAGLRWDAVDVNYRLTTLTTGEVATVDSSDRMVSWRAGAVYKPAPNGSVYVGASTSFNPSVDAAATGAALSTAPTAANNPALEPEETRNYEVGTKWDALDGRLSLTWAVFRTEKTNARTRNATSDPFVLSGRQRVAGAEVGISGAISRRWTALVNYAFMDSTIVASAAAAEEGQNLALTPENTFNAWTTYQLRGGLLVGGGVQYMDSVFRNTLNTQRVPSYWLANALASYEVNQLLTLRLNAQNLTDTSYVDRVGGGHYIPGPRRQVMLTADVTF